MIGSEKLALIEEIAPHLAKMSDATIDQAIETGEILKDTKFHGKIDLPFAQFYAPFDWINENADIVLIGITPGRRQAKAALKTLRAALSAGKTPLEAAELAKQAASFDGEMRVIAKELMDRFQLQKVFRLGSCSDLFEQARHRAHYTSLLRYPVLHWQTKRNKSGASKTGWFDFSGGDDVFTESLLVQSREKDFEREIAHFKNAWLVPFGPTPAKALERLAAQGVLDRDRILPGINHPSGTQRNRHNCQLNRTDDHSKCAANVGCKDLRARSIVLEAKVAAILAQPSSQ